MMEEIKPKNKMMSSEMRSLLKTLTDKERRYFRLMWPKYGVLFLTAPPGVAKSAIGKSIARKMGFEYKDMRLSMVDETDFKFPYLTDMEIDGEVVKVSDYTVPKWAINANLKPTIIHFEELNRASPFVRNAALQILLEREIGDFKFNDNVLMMSSGNLGDEDGTDVEELDQALNNRLIHVIHTLTSDEWIVDFANENCHPIITSFIKNYPERMIQKPTEGTRAYATPRSWTILSEFIVSNFGIDSSPSDFISEIRLDAVSIVGNSAIKFLQYCDNMLRISIKDVMNNYENIKDELAKFNRDKNSELIQSLKSIDISKLKDNQINNLFLFLDLVGDDEKVGYILGILDDPDIDISIPNLKKFILRFKPVLKNIRKKNNLNKTI